MNLLVLTSTDGHQNNVQLYILLYILKIVLGRSSKQFGLSQLSTNTIFHKYQYAVIHLNCLNITYVSPKYPTFLWILIVQVFPILNSPPPHFPLRGRLKWSHWHSTNISGFFVCTVFRHIIYDNNADILQIPVNSEYYWYKMGVYDSITKSFKIEILWHIVEMLRHNYTSFTQSQTTQQIY